MKVENPPKQSSLVKSFKMANQQRESRMKLRKTQQPTHTNTHTPKWGKDQIFTFGILTTKKNDDEENNNDKILYR